jgi:hypothetical protein
MDITQLAGTIPGNYKIDSCLSRDGAAVVCYARQISLDHTTVLNAFPLTFSSYPARVYQVTCNTPIRETT